MANLVSVRRCVCYACLRPYGVIESSLELDPNFWQAHTVLGATNTFDYVRIVDRAFC